MRFYIYILYEEVLQCSLEPLRGNSECLKVLIGAFSEAYCTLTSAEGIQNPCGY